MRNQPMSLTIAMFALLFGYVAVVYGRDPAVVLFKHREYLKQWVEEYEQTSRSRRQQPSFLQFKQISHEDVYYWETNKNVIITAFVELCEKNRMRTDSLSENLLRLNAVQTGILISILGDIPHEMDWRIMPILERIPYPYLIQHRAAIIDLLKRDNNINRYSYLAAVIDPPANMKKTLLTFDNLSVGLRARLGDKKCETELLQQVNNYTNGWNISALSDELFLCGTVECLKSAIELFAKYKPPMNETGDCTAMARPFQNQRTVIIGRFMKYYPDLPLLNAEYYQLKLQFTRKRNDPIVWDMTVKYMDKFVKWGNKEFGVNAKLENYFLFQGQCEPVASRERTIREMKANPRHDSLMRKNPGYRMDFEMSEKN